MCCIYPIAAAMSSHDDEQPQQLSGDLMLDIPQLTEGTQQGAAQDDEASPEMHPLPSNLSSVFIPSFTREYVHDVLPEEISEMLPEELVQLVQQLAAACGVHEAMVAGLLPSFLCAAMGSGVHVYVAEELPWNMVPNIWSAVVAASGAGK